MAQAARFSHHMSDEDALMWNIEKDPVLRSTILAVALFDSVPDWERVRQRIDRTTRFIPRLRQRVVSPPFRIAPPSWIAESMFDLDFHLRRVRLCAPGTMRALFDVLQPIATASFDRARPLWEFTLIEGLDGPEGERRRVRDESAPFGDRRGGRHGIARALRRSRARRGGATRERGAGGHRTGERPDVRRHAELGRAQPPPRARHRATRAGWGRPRDRERAPGPDRNGDGSAENNTVDRPHARACDAPDVDGHARSRPRTAARGVRRTARRVEARRQGDRREPQRRIRRGRRRRCAALSRTSRRGAGRVADDVADQLAPRRRRRGWQSVRTGPVPGTDLDRGSARPHCGARCARARMAGRARVADDEHARRHPQPLAHRHDDRAVRRDAQVLRLRHLEHPGRARSGLPGGRPGRALLRVRPTGRRGVQCRADLALRHVLRRRGDRHHRGPRPRCAARVSARTAFPRCWHWPDP